MLVLYADITETANWADPRKFPSLFEQIWKPKHSSYGNRVFPPPVSNLVEDGKINIAPNKVFRGGQIFFAKDKSTLAKGLGTLPLGVVFSGKPADAGAIGGATSLNTAKHANTGKQLAWFSGSYDTEKFGAGLRAALNSFSADSKHINRKRLLKRGYYVIVGDQLDLATVDRKTVEMTDQMALRQFESLLGRLSDTQMMEDLGFGD